MPEDRALDPIEVSLALDDALIGSIAERVADLLSPQRDNEESAWPEWMNIDTLARYLDCSPQRIRKLVARREIPFAQEAAGCRISFCRRSIDEWLRGVEIPERQTPTRPRASHLSRLGRLHGPTRA